MRAIENADLSIFSYVNHDGVNSIAATSTWKCAILSIDIYRIETGRICYYDYKLIAQDVFIQRNFKITDCNNKI